jgi:hypothetical protein
VSDLSNIEKRKLEQLFGMGSGYVLNFSNRTFDEFVIDSVGVSIYEAKYASAGGSKANHLRSFWRLEPNHVVGKLVADLIEYARETATPEEQQLLETCWRTAQRLQQSAPVPEIGALVPNSPEKEFEALSRTVKAAINNNEPEAGLDRLHTFVVKYIRAVCIRRGIATDRDKPLHALMGEYVKALRQAGAIESEMTERILKSSISLLEAFNRVRNEQSFAHDNGVLNYEESLLIFNNIANTIRFIGSLESRNERAGEAPASETDDMPF